MKEQHPIDELFARALRDGEAPPPPAVHKGLARQRGWQAGTGLPRRTWPLLLLLLGTLAGYWVIAPVGRADIGGTTPVAAAGATAADRSAAPMQQGAQPGGESASHADDPPPEVHASGMAPPPSPGPLAGNHAAGMQAAKPPQQAEEPIRTEGPRMAGTLGIEPAHHGTPAALAATSQAAAVAAHPGRQAEIEPYSGRQPRPAPEATSAQARSAPPGPLAVRWPSLALDAATTAPMAADALPFRGPRHAWWVAATAGFLAETRTWKGGDSGLRQALQGTEVPHPATAFGVLAGREGRGGWNLAAGIEYSASRYAFNHTDRFRSRTDSVVTWVVTFNNQVLSSHTDTLSVYGNVQQSIAAINRVSTVRVPVELGWHRALRRFHLGARAGLAAELNFIRSGATLARMDGGTRSVDASKADDRTTLLLAGTVAADLGYALSEQWGLWASPTFGTGLFPLSAANEAPYALPQRFGVRFRLAYTLKSAH